MQFVRDLIAVITATWAEWQYVVRSGDWTQAERDATRDNLTSLFDAYQDFSRQHRDRDPLSREMLGRFLVAMGGISKRILIYSL